MPYASVQQMRFMHARHPEIAARWDAEVRGQKKRGKYHKPPRRVAKANTWQVNAVGKADSRDLKTGAAAGALGLATLRAGGELEHRATLARRSAQGRLATVSSPTVAAAVGGRHAFTPAPPGAHAAPGVSAAERSTAVARATRRVTAVERATAPQIKLARRVKAGGIGLAALGTVAAVRGLRRRSSPPAFPEY